jgi:FtsH-binding integral membrane protein
MSNSVGTVLEKPKFTQLVSSKIDIESRSNTLKATYWLLLGSIACAFIGGYIGFQSTTLMNFFTTTFGVIVAIVLLNAIPMFALAAVSKPSLGIVVLGVDGLLSGIVISPLLFVANATVPESIPIAAALTLLIFGSITTYVMFARKTFSAPRALTVGLFISITAVVLIGTRVNLGGLEVALSAATAVFGVILLVSNTSRVLLNPVGVGAVPGALMLFAGIFNVFVGLLRVILWIMGGGRKR